MILLTQCNVEVAAKKKQTGGRSDNVINELKKERDIGRYGFAEVMRIDQAK